MKPVIYIYNIFFRVFHFSFKLNMLCSGYKINSRLLKRDPLKLYLHIYICTYACITGILCTGKLGFGKVNRKLCMIMCGQSKAARKLNMYDLVIARAQINKYVHIFYIYICMYIHIRMYMNIFIVY